MGEQAGGGYELYMDSICSQGKRQAWLEPDSTKKKKKRKKNRGREIQSKIQNERTLFNILNPWESLTSNRRQNHSFSPFIKANSACQGYEPHRWGPHWIPDIQAGLIYLANLLTKEVRNELFGEDLPVSRFFFFFDFPISFDLVQPSSFFFNGLPSSVFSQRWFSSL